MIRSYSVQNRYNYDVSCWRSVNIRLLQTVIFAQELENIESSNREQEKLTSHTWRDKNSQTGFLNSLFVLRDQSYQFGIAYYK